MDIMIEVKTLMMHETNEFSLSLNTCAKIFDVAPPPKKRVIRINTLWFRIEFRTGSKDFTSYPTKGIRFCWPQFVASNRRVKRHEHTSPTKVMKW